MAAELSDESEDTSQVISHVIDSIEESTLENIEEHSEIDSDKAQVDALDENIEESLHDFSENTETEIFDVETEEVSEEVTNNLDEDVDNSEIEVNDDKISTETTEVKSQISDESSQNEASEDLISIIVQTKNIAALQRGIDRHDARFKESLIEAENEVQSTVDEIIASLKEQGFDIQTNQYFSASFTGFSAKVDSATYQALLKHHQVQSVNIQQQFKQPASPQMHSSGSLVGLDPAYYEQFGYKGDGMVVSVIDTGADPEHRDFNLDPDVPVRYNEAAMQALIELLKLPGKYYSSKIPYGFNYADNVQTIKDVDEHGLHVAGTIGANGNIEEGGIQGVAPHVQLLIMKAFTNDQAHSSVFEDTWLKAFDDSIKLGADVINMSLGSASGFTLDGNSPTALAFKKAREAGIIPMVAAGNDRNTAWGQDAPNLAANPDQGVLGYPAVLEDSMAVASSENRQYMETYVSIKTGEEEVTVNVLGKTPFEDNFSEKYHSIVDKGKGLPGDYEENEDLSDKYVLIHRGDISFGEKYARAVEHGAAGVIIVDNIEQDYPMNMTGIEENSDVPVMFIRKKDGEKILQLISQSDQNPIQVKIPHGKESFENPQFKHISEFSSWGPTTDLRLKPDITAPGGHIYSLMSDNRYQDMSGTSMATPHMSGLAVLLMQYLYENNFLTRQEDGKADPKQDDLTMLMLMNTAVPMVDPNSEDQTYYSPTVQGAGLVNIANAMKNKVTVTATNERDTLKDGKLELREVGEEFNVQLELKNYGDVDQTYQLKYELIHSTVDQDSNRYTETTQNVQRVALGEITVKAGETLSIEKILNTYGIPADQYIHGFFILEAQGEDTPNLTVPFLGYKGQWDQPRIIDHMIDFEGPDKVNYPIMEYFNEQGELTGVDKSAFVRLNEGNGWNYWTAYNVDDKPTVFVSQVNIEGQTNNLTPVLSFLRDAVNVDFRIEDANNQIIRNLMHENRIVKVGKLYMDNGRYNFLQQMRNATWDMRDANNEYVADGIYKYVIEAEIDYQGAQRQRYEYQIVVDNTPPEAEVTIEDHRVTIKATDNLSGIDYIEIYNPEGGWISGPAIDRKATPMLLETEQIIELPDYLQKAKVLMLYIRDNSGQVTRKVIRGQLPEEQPEDGNQDETEENEQPEESEEPNQPENPENPEQPENPSEETEDKPIIIENQQIDPEDYTFEMGATTKELPLITINHPGVYGIYGENDEIAGFNAEVKNFKEIHRAEYIIRNSKGEVIKELTPAQISKLGDLTKVYGEYDIKDIQESDQYNLELIVYTLSDNDKLVKQQISRPFRIDRQAPKVNIQQIESQDGRLLIEVDYEEDMNYIEIFVNNHQILREDVTYDTLLPKMIKGKKVFELPKVLIGKTVQIRAYDDANQTIFEMELKDPTQPEETTQESETTTDETTQESETTTEETTEEVTSEETTQESETTTEETTEEVTSEETTQESETTTEETTEEVTSEETTQEAETTTEEVTSEETTQNSEITEEVDEKEQDDQTVDVSPRNIDELIGLIKELTYKLAHLDQYRYPNALSIESIHQQIEVAKRALNEKTNEESIKNLIEKLNAYNREFTLKSGAAIPSAQKSSVESDKSQSNNLPPQYGHSTISISDLAMYNLWYLLILTIELVTDYLIP